MKWIVRVPQLGLCGWAVAPLAWCAAAGGPAVPTQAAADAAPPALSAPGTAAAWPQRLGLSMVHIPAGQFVMGSCKAPAAGPADAPIAGQGYDNTCWLKRTDADAMIDETPQRKLRVPAFQLGQTEVTLGQFKQFMAAADRSDLDTPEFRHSNRFGDTAAVVHVSWQDAQDFVQWLNRVAGPGWRLPTEVEWEYACRAGRPRDLLCGTGRAESLAWIQDNSAHQPQPVARKKPNAWGLHDMSGNAYEWVQDCWHEHYVAAPADSSAWQTRCTDHGRVLRGGSWLLDASYARAASRIHYAPDLRMPHFGLRLARSPG